MHIYDLPIKTDKRIKDKAKASIFEDKIICHPDLLKKVKQGMAIMRTSDEQFDKDLASWKERMEEKE